MKTVYFVRHAKSSWKDASLSDKDRPLKKRGKKDAVVMGQLLKKLRITPDEMVSSPASRARETAQIIANEIGFKDKPVLNKDIYFTGINEIFSVIKKFENSRETIFVFGHNPHFTDIANIFSKKEIANVPTCGIFGVQFPINKWSEASKENGKIIFFDYPKKHRK